MEPELTLESGLLPLLDELQQALQQLQSSDKVLQGKLVLSAPEDYSNRILAPAVVAFMAQHPAEFDPRKYLQASVVAMMDICKDRYQAFGAAGQGSKIKAISLEKMVKLYESGKLTPNIK